MASIRKRAGKNGAAYQAEVRLRGFPAVRQSFRRMTDAKRWAAQTEAAIRERRYFRHAEAQKHTFGEMVDRYLEEQTVSEARRAQLLWWQTELGEHILADITAAAINERKSKLVRGTT